MNFVVKLFPEITIKSRSVRKQMTKILRANLRNQFKRHNISADVQNRWDSLVVVVNEKHHDDESVRRHCIRILTHTPGIGSALEVTEHPFEGLPNAFELIRDAYREAVAGKSFCVRIKRAGQHDFTSHQAEIYIGGGILKETDAREVSLKNPEVVVRAEIRNQTLQIVGHDMRGLGGFPLGSQGDVLSLISGGFDSTVSSYLMNRRGLKTHFLFFNLGGSAHEIGVKQVAHYLWSSYGESHRVKFVTVPFEDVVGEILKNVETSQMGVVLKRMMLRAASEVAYKLRVPALVTGEAVAQVASQTITNLAVIDKACDHMVLRPLAAMDKQEIIDISRRIGAETFAANMPEYCGVISVNPTTVGDRRLVEEAEQAFDMEVLTQALKSARVQRIDEVLDGSDSGLDNLELVSTPTLNDVIIDIRHPHEVADAPLQLTNNEVMTIPFYDLDGQAANLNHSGRYLLYCQQGTMSKIHAHHLNQQFPDKYAVLLDSH
ncbi:tRNA 4-thiouridine(8) synthase ThiI [Bacterioplanes sanyensis]|uniref:Probable tRNA sulfurtransferase n=1 Tax=Bacterioplanes sanyensis TaxID=1249553 RepID=A0A222FLF8_9GAMM|nr:tRNA uracil 4-sulfurtransferase ThiI [Bacterioplanes sanyensis]ASP39857.1 tRNA 4-thiouridine(8) synthase ThiI [Bacterioplanes sanyensis]